MLHPNVGRELLARVGPESYLRIEEIWKADQRREYEKAAYPQTLVPQAVARAQQPAPQPDQAAMCHAAVAVLAKARGQHHGKFPAGLNA
jgi:hypothetical protein